MRKDAGGDHPDEPMAYGDYPAVFQSADAQSLAGQRAYIRFAGLELSLVILGSALGVVAALLSATWQAAAVIATISFIGALITRVTIRLRGDDHAWFDGRAVAESVKTQTWRFMMRAAPFANDDDASSAFTSELTDILHARPGVLSEFAPGASAGGQITPRMRTQRTRSLADRLRFYGQHRLAEQADWYRGTGLRHRKIAQRWSACALLAEAAAIVVAVLMIVFKPLADIGLLGLFAAFAAAFSAWAQLGRHAELSKAYGLAYQELLTFLSLVDEVTTEPQLEQLVDAGEGAISREHTMWVARRADPLGRLGPRPSAISRQEGRSRHRQPS
jgi:hypothetical protein